MARHAQVFGGADLRRFIRAFNQSASEIRGSWLPALPLEMAYLEALEPQPPPQSQAQLRTPQRSQPDLNEPVVRPSQPKSQAGQQMKDTTAAPERAPAVMGPEEGSSSSLQLEENWQTILALTRQHNPNTYGVLNSCRARRLKDDILTLGFASDVIRSKMEKSENLEVVISVLKQVFKRDIIVRCVTLTGKRSTPPPGVDSDGMVASALRDLGGEIVDIHK